MKFSVAILSIVVSITGVRGAEPVVVPPEPSMAEIAKKAQSAAIVLTCEPTKEQSGLEVVEVLKGQKAYSENTAQVAKLIPRSDSKALATEGFRELVFIGPANETGAFLDSSSLALWPVRIKQIGPREFKFLAHDYSELKRVLHSQNQEAQQGGAEQPATRPESDSEGGDKAQPESEGRSR